MDSNIVKDLNLLLSEVGITKENEPRYFALMEKLVIYVTNRDIQVSDHTLELVKESLHARADG